MGLFDITNEQDDFIDDMAQLTDDYLYFEASEVD